MQIQLKTILLACTLLFFSCIDDEDEPRVGFSLTIHNTTNMEHENAKVIIGGMKNEKFVGTESYLLPTIRIRNSDSEAQLVTLNGNRWIPNLNLIHAISEKAYFAFQFEGGKEILLHEGDSLITFDVAINGVVKSKYGARLSIGILPDSARGNFHEENFFSLSLKKGKSLGD